ncbi:MAG: hypothetical protein AAB460_00420 [Patescibacteria group bacterium]|mgnify:CR=1 FL=1
MPKKTLITLITLVAIVIVVLVGIFAWYKLSRSAFEQQSPTLSETEIAEIVGAVGKHIRLPQDEEPLIATIADIDALVATQPFYQGAKNGDILLIYQTVGKAILYSSSDDILINVGPIVLDEETTTPPPSDETSTDETVEQ